jgi:hypothetical protein
MITNYLAPTSFIVTVSRLPKVEFFTQTTSIPSISISPVTNNTPIQNFYSSGDRIEYSDFDLGFIVDERMDNYIEVLRWMEGLGSPETTDQYKDIENSKDGITSDITITIHNSHKNPNIRVIYKNCFPTALSQVDLSVTSTDVAYPQATVTFRYDTFVIEQI